MHKNQFYIKFLKYSFIMLTYYIRAHMYKNSHHPLYRDM